MFNKIQQSFTAKPLACSHCGAAIKVGERFTATILMPAEKQMLVSRLDNAIAKTADAVVCETCQKQR